MGLVNYPGGIYWCLGSIAGHLLAGLHPEAASPSPFSKTLISIPVTWQPGLFSLDWLLHLISGTVTDPVVDTGHHGSIKLVNKELPISSGLRELTSPVSNGKSPEGNGIRDGDKVRACSLTVPESPVLELIQIKTTTETCSEFAGGRGGRGRKWQHLPHGIH